jgi:hypothetical protein
LRARGIREHLAALDPLARRLVLQEGCRPLKGHGWTVAVPSGSRSRWAARILGMVGWLTV